MGYREGGATHRTGACTVADIGVTIYSPRFTAAQISRTEARLGFALVPSSLEKVKVYVAHLDSLIDPHTGKLTRALLPDETAWIRNEKLLSALDYRYWAPRYATMQTADNRLTRLTPNIAQSIVLDILGEMEEQQFALHLQNLKARQLGVSTLFESLIAHRSLFYRNVNAIVASADEKRSGKMAEMIWLTFDHLPWWMKPAISPDNAGEKAFPGHNSGVTLQHGKQVTGVARGTTVSVAHLSEIPFWDDPRKSIDASLMKAIHDDPSKMVLLESTADGMGDWWHLTWEYNVKHWGTKARFRPVFLPWFVGSDIYPTATWLRKTPVPANYVPAALTAAHAESAEEYVRSSDYLCRYLGNDWRMPREQQWFWEVSREEAKDKQELSQFYQEMPANPTQAFQASGHSPFEPELLEVIESGVREPWGVFGLTGDGINRDSYKFCPWTHRDVDRTRAVINIEARWNQQLPKYRWTLVPLKFTGWDSFAWQGKVVIWEPPTTGHRYGFGIDTSHGVDQDSSVIQGMRIGDYYHSSEQVLEFANPNLSADDLWPYAMALGTWYGTVMNGDGRTVQPRMVIECNENGGNCQVALRTRGWRHFHDRRRYNKKKLNPTAGGEFGWMTDSHSRPMMVSKTIKALREGWLRPNSPRFIGEMKTFSKEEGSQRMAAELGYHDDLFMALGIVYYSTFCLEAEGEENQTKGYSGYGSEEQPYAVYTNPQAMVEAPAREFFDGTAWVEY